MKKLILIVAVGLLSACGTTTSENKSDSTSVKQDTTVVDPIKEDTSGKK